MVFSLELKIIEGKDLIPMDTNGYSDPYCIAEINGIKVKTGTQYKTLNPVWENELMNFTLDSTKDTLIIYIWDWDRFKPDDRMGMIKVPVNSFKLNEMNDSWINVTPMKQKDKVSGQLHVRVTLSDNENRIFEKHGELMEAVANSDSTKLSDLLIEYKNSKHSDAINSQDESGFVALHLAPKAEDDMILQDLLAVKGIDVKAINNALNTPMHYFCQYYRHPNCIEIFDVFISKGADVNAANEVGETPLHKAMFNNYVRLMLVKQLLSSGANVNVQTNYGDTPLTYACRCARTDLVHLLLKAGADIDLKGKGGVTAKEIAKEVDAEKIINLIQNFEDLRDFFLKIKKSEYLFVFYDQAIFVDLLPELDEEILKGIGIVDKEDVKIILSEGQKLNNPDLPDAKNNKQITYLKDADKSRTSEATLKLKKKILNPLGKQSFDPLAEDSDSESGEELGTEESILDIKKMVKAELIDSKNLEYTDKIGTGASGVVYKAILNGKKEQNVVAVKVLKKLSQQEIAEFKVEFQIMSKLTSRNIVHLYGACVEPKLSLVMEYCSKGSLYHVLKQPRFRLTWKRTFFFIIGFTSGLWKLHCADPVILHRDFKSLNILVSRKWIVKVADFGTSKLSQGSVKQNTNEMVGTLLYLAPEVYESQEFSEKSDVYALGIVLWEVFNKLMTRKYLRPYEEYKEFSMEGPIAEAACEKGIRPTVPKNTPKAIKILIERCWKENPNDRPTVFEVLSHLKVCRDVWLEKQTEFENNEIDLGKKLLIRKSSRRRLSRDPSAPKITSTTTRTRSSSKSKNTKLKPKK